MKTTTLLILSMVLNFGCKKKDLPVRRINDEPWWLGTATVIQSDPSCQQKPVMLHFDTVSDALGILPQSFAWSYYVPDSLKSFGTRIRVSYRKATTEEIQQCGYNEYGLQIALKDIQIVK